MKQLGLILFVLLIAGTFFGSFALAQSETGGVADAGGHEFTFADGDRTLCPDGGLIDIESATFATGQFGFATPEAAVAEYERGIQSAASQPEIDTRLRPLLAPMREFRTIRSQIDSTDVAYFDLPALNKRDLEARIVVELVGEDGWKVAGSYRCESVLVTDMQEFETTSREVYSDDQ